MRAAPKEKEASRFFDEACAWPEYDADGHIISLTLAEQRIGARVVKLLGGLARLTTLCLQDTSISDGNLRAIARISTLERLDLRSCKKITPFGFSHLRGLTRLRELRLYETSFSDAALSALSGLQDLEILDLAATRITDRGVQAAASFKKLRWLYLELLPQLSDHALKKIGSLAQLRWLDLRGSPFTDRALAHLQGMKSLERLYLAGTCVTDAGFKRLAGLSGLKYLDAHHTQVGDDALRHIARLPRLQELGLMGTRVTDEGLKHLKKLTGLRTLNLESTRVSVAAKKKLKLSLPRCVIFISQPQAGPADLPVFNVAYFRDHPPRCIAGFRREAVKSPSEVVFRLACQCGNKQGTVLGHPLTRFNKKYDGDEMVSPLALQCSRCRKVTEIIDTDVHTYHGELGVSSYYRGKGRREAFACPRCGQSIVELTVHFWYGGAEGDLAEDDPDIKAEDYFSAFRAVGKCAGCGKKLQIAEFV